MVVEQIYTGCLAQGAYYIESEGEAAVIDPLREVHPYIERAAKSGARIKYVFETHYHADFVSGHVDLSKKTGAKIVLGPVLIEPGYDAYIAKDGEEFQLGKVKIRLIHTPGHTMESSCYLLIDENGRETALFTGDTLFIGDVGRPDLAQKVVKDLTPEKLASHLYDSIHNKILPLPDHLIVYPAHGAGSPCGKKMSKETSDTLGNQKKTNYALDPTLTREQFIAKLLDGLTPPPGYFPANVIMNVKGYESIDNVFEKAKRALDPKEFEIVATETRPVILDTRSADDFAKGHIPNSINIGLDGSFAIWVGTLIPDVTTPLLLVCDEGREEEAITRLARVGFDNVVGYLKGGIEAWKNAGFEIDTVEQVTAEELAELYAKEDINIVDVRKNSEYNSEHVVEAMVAPLDYINDSMKLLNPEKKYYIHCAGGYRSMAFISILKSRGYDKLVNVIGGFKAMKETGKFRVTDYVCPTTEL